MAEQIPQLPLDEYLLEMSRDIFAECNLPERARTKVAVTLRRRFRGQSKSDLLGCFDYITGEWLGDRFAEIGQMMNMYSYPVVRPVVRANQSAMIQARVECTVKPSSQKPGSVGVASIAEGIYKHWNNHPDYWSNNLESQIAQQVQTDPGCFLRTCEDPHAESLFDIEVDEYSDEPLEEPGSYICGECGSDGPLFQEQMGQAANGRVPCPQCQQMAEIEVEPGESLEPQFKGKTKHPSGNITLQPVSAFQIRIDERNTKNGKIRNAEWLEWHYLEEEEKLQAKVPYFSLGSPSEWSFPLKWEYALETGTDLFLKPWSSNGSRRRSLHEVRKIYLRPNRYRSYVAPADFDLDRGDGYVATNQRGEPMLSLKAGERLIDKYPNGFWFMVSGERLVPLAESCDLRDEWVYLWYLNDSASFWAQSASELNELQRAANNLYTIDMQHRESGSIATTIYDRMWFDADTFERQLSPTKEGTYIEKDDDIHRHYATVTPPNMQGAMDGVNFIRGSIGDIGGPQPAALGAPAKGEPYAAQRLQKQQSLGLLSPSQQSKAEGKSFALMQYLKFVQKTKPIEWFQYIGTMYGEEWKEQDIEAFLNANLDLSLLVWYKEGSEVPDSLIEQELKYRDFLLNMGTIAGQTGRPDLIRPEMLSQYAELSGVNYDIENVAADKRLAASRFEKIKAWLEANQYSTLPPEELLEIALADRSLEPWAGELHATHKEFYGDKIRGLLAQDDPPYALADACVKMIERHEAAGVVQTQTDTASKIEGDAPAIAAQLEASKMQAQQEQELAQQQAQIKAQELQAANQRQAMADEAKAQREQASHQAQAQIKAAELAVKMEDIRSRVAPTPEQETERSPRQVVAESAKYSDLPPAAQSDILREDLGLPATGTNQVHDSTIAQKQIAASKARASQSGSNGASK